MYRPEERYLDTLRFSATVKLDEKTVLYGPKRRMV